jgi:hypothetical protein
MRPGQNKRMRGRNNRKGPNPLTRSFESNGPDVKIRGTAQHVAEKYLQLARDAQSSGDTIAAENLLQHAEHYFRVIAAAQTAQQQAAGGYGRQSFEAEAESEDDDDFVPLPDRFAPLAERLPQQPPAFQPSPPPYQPQPQAQPQVQPHFVQPQPQPFEERPPFEPRHERAPRQERPFAERGRDRGRDRNAAEGGTERPSQGFERSRENRRFPRNETPERAAEREPAAPPASELPSFITAPVRSLGAEPEPQEAFVMPERITRTEREGGGYHLTSRRRRRPRTPTEGESAGGEDEAPQSGELPLAD